MKQWLLLLTTCVVLGSCSEKEDDDREAPAITFTAPTNNQVVPAGELRIKATIADNAYIGQVHIEIYNTDTENEVEHVHIHPGSKLYALDYAITVEAGTHYKIKIIADDPAANTSSQQVEISCN